MNSCENIAHLCVRKPCELGFAEKVAYKWIHNDLSESDFTYWQIDQASNRFANVLKRLGILKGERVSIYLPKSPELIEYFFGIQKNEAVSCILFSTFGESALYDRLADSRTRFVVTKLSLLKRLQKANEEGLEHLQAILVTDLEDHQDGFVLSLPRLLAQASPDFAFSPQVNAETPAFIQYTSGSTGKPKGALHVHAGSAAMTNSFKEVFGIQAGERFWCTADPAWITGLVYGVIAPLALRTKQIQFGGNFGAETWMEILQCERVNVWYTAPTALRMLMQEEAAMFKQYDYSALRRMYSVGEPLNPEVYHWGKKVFGCVVYDNWFQSETGSIMITNKPGRKVKPGSMGKPLSYIQAMILDEDMQPLPVRQQGSLCLKKGWGSMFRTYINKEELYQEKFNGDIYISGDLAYRDEEGYFWYVSRADDRDQHCPGIWWAFEVEVAPGWKSRRSWTWPSLACPPHPAREDHRLPVPQERL